jgi:hypothetical protein
MRGDQLAWQWRVIRAIKASPNVLAVTAIAQRQESGIPTTNHVLEVLQAVRFPLHTERVNPPIRWPFINTFKFKILPLLSSKAARFGKKKGLEFHCPENIHLIPRHIFHRAKRAFAALAPSREAIGRLHAPQL